MRWKPPIRGGSHPNLAFNGRASMRVFRGRSTQPPSVLGSLAVVVIKPGCHEAAPTRRLAVAQTEQASSGLIKAERSLEDHESRVNPRRSL